MTPEQKIAALRADNARVYEQVRRIVAAERKVIEAAKAHSRILSHIPPGDDDLIDAVHALEAVEGEGKIG
jgi:hypothetical protein